MATTNYSWNLPTVGGSEDAWGTQLNANWTALDTLLGGVSQTEFAKLDGLTATTADLNTASTHYVPSGGIIMWSGAIGAIPSGWLLCDGTNGTPDLRDRFIVGAGSSYAVGATGGADTVTLSEAQIPGHSHSFSATTGGAGGHSHTYSGTTSGQSNDHTHGFSGTTNTTGDHSHLYYWTSVSGSANVPDGDSNTGNAPTASGSTSTAGAHNHTFSGTTGGVNSDHTHTFSGTTSGVGDHTHSVSGTTGVTGGTTAHENRPPYFALAYIMKA